RRRGLEDQVGKRVLGQQPVDPPGGRGDAEVAGADQPVGGGVHADHRVHLDGLAAQQLDQQVGADVAGPDDRGGELAHDFSENVTVTEPIRSKVALTVSPGPNGMAAHTEPGSTTCPAWRVMPRWPSTLASQTRALTG